MSRLWGVVLSAVVVSVVAASSIQSPNVRIGLFNGRPIDKFQIVGYSGLRISGRIAHGVVTVARHGPMVFARDSEGGFWQDQSLTIASRSGRWMDVEIPGQGHKRTVGILEVNTHGKALQVINILSIETYVLGVVNGELGSLQFNPESLKAQIVASRSFVLASRGRHAVEGYDFCDGPHCQVFSGTAEINQKYKAAVEETRGLFLTYGGRAIPGYFHDNCGGHTAAIQDVWGSAAVPYLQSVEDGYCLRSPRAHWSFPVDRKRLTQVIRQAGWLPGSDALDTVRVASFDHSGRADQIAIEGNHSVWVSAAAFRQTLSRSFKSEVLPSTFFSIEKTRTGFLMVGRGWGHGVGLCQQGAIQMANTGRSYRQILAHFYPGTSLDRLPDVEFVKSEFETQALR
jgi:stage II sporulation protein D